MVGGAQGRVGRAGVVAGLGGDEADLPRRIVGPAEVAEPEPAGGVGGGRRRAAGAGVPVLDRQRDVGQGDAGLGVGHGALQDRGGRRRALGARIRRPGPATRRDVSRDGPREQGQGQQGGVQAPRPGRLRAWDAGTGRGAGALGQGAVEEREPAVLHMVKAEVVPVVEFGLNPTLTLVANSRLRLIGRSLGNMGTLAKGKTRQQTNSPPVSTLTLVANSSRPSETGFFSREDTLSCLDSGLSAADGNSPPMSTFVSPAAK